MSNSGGLRQRFPKEPHGGKIRDRAAQLQPQKALERLPVVDLKLGMFIREIVEPLQNQNLEHHYHVIGFPPRRRFSVPLHCGLDTLVMHAGKGPVLNQLELGRLARVLGLNEVGLNALAQGAYPVAELTGLSFCVHPLRMPYGVGVANAYVVSTGGDSAILFDTGASHPELHRAWPSRIQEIEAVFITH